MEEEEEERTANHSRGQCPVLALGLTMENHLDWQVFS